MFNLHDRGISNSPRYSLAVTDGTLSLHACFTCAYSDNSENIVFLTQGFSICVYQVSNAISTSSQPDAHTHGGQILRIILLRSPYLSQWPDDHDGNMSG